MSRTVLRAYRGEGWPIRLRIRLRWATVPLSAVAALVPASGRVLEIGCGHGLLTLSIAEGARRRVVGTDIDLVKLEVARRAADAAGLGSHVRFEPASPRRVPDGPWDVIVICDVLYLSLPEDQESLVRTCARALEPGGTLIVKELADTPRWKWRASALQELVAVRVLRVTTSSGGLRQPGLEAVARWLADEGLTVRTERLDRGYHVPHGVVTGTVPGP